ncbi:hypothetical protein ACFQ1S_40030, partial [Kibdelosporangium lantanae]
FSLCEWGENKPWTWASSIGHLWRTTGDISDSYSSMLDTAVHLVGAGIGQQARRPSWSRPLGCRVGSIGWLSPEESAGTVPGSPRS